MKINYTMYESKLTGGTRVIFEIANKLVERGHKVTITTLGSPLDIQWFNPKFKIIYVSCGSFLEKILRNLSRRVSKADFYPAIFIERLAKIIPDCDINVATFCFTAFSVFRSDKGIPFYHMQHYEPLFFDNPYFCKLAKESYYLPLNKIANSIWLKNTLEEKGIEDVIDIVNPAIDHNIFYSHLEKLHNTKKKVVALGKIIKWKGLLNLFKAMKIVIKQRKDVELVLFGCKSLPPEYKKYQVPYKCVGTLVDKELAKLYSEADVVICSSWYESFPLPPLEAMACGAPVITTRDGTEDYALNEENALVVSPRNSQALAEAILRVLENEKLVSTLRENGFKTAKQFTWDKTTDKVEKLFLERLNKKI